MLQGHFAVSLGRFADRQGLGDCRKDQGRITDRGQSDEEHAIGEYRRLFKPVGGGQAQAGLADPGRAGEGHQAHVRLAQQLTDGPNFLCAPHKARQRRGQMRGRQGLK